MDYLVHYADGGLFLAHHGIKGMKWGVRRYQNKDGTLTKAGRKRYYKDWGSSNYSVENLTKRGKRLRKTVLDQADKNRDIIDEYKAQADRLKSINTNPHAKRLVDDLNKKYDQYKQAKETFSKSGSEDDRKKLELAFEKLQDAHDTLDAANRRDTDQLYAKYLEKLADKTLSQLGSEVTDQGRNFVKYLIGNYYKTELD